MRVALLGYGSQGKSSYDYWSRVTDDITICDANEQLELPPKAKAKLGPTYLQNLSQFDLLVRSPSVHPRSIVEANLTNPSVLGMVTTNTNEFMRVCPSLRVVGVTGTKGKGTTSTLIAKMLEASLAADGHRVHLGGNIGIPPLELLKNNIHEDDWVVLELANFQLIDIKYSPPIAVCLMVVPEHMDWHTDMAEYVTAKQQLFRWQQLEDIAIYYPDSRYSKEVAGVTPGQKIPYCHQPGAYVEEDRIMIDGNVVCATSELKLPGKHNWQNVCAAITAVWQVRHDLDAIRSVLANFSGLPHHIEHVRDVSGVHYYDDSFGTTPETAIAAIESFDGPKVLILGGSDKQANYDALAETVALGNVRHVVTIGQTGPTIAEALDLAGYHQVTQCPKTTMYEIVQLAQSCAQPGDILLLSPACASFGLFANYKDRGEQFHKVVNELDDVPAPDAPDGQSLAPAGSPAPGQPPAA